MFRPCAAAVRLAEVTNARESSTTTHLAWRHAVCSPSAWRNVVVVDLRHGLPWPDLLTEPANEGVLYLALRSICHVVEASKVHKHADGQLRFPPCAARGGAAPGCLWPPRPSPCAKVERRDKHRLPRPRKSSLQTTAVSLEPAISRSDQTRTGCGLTSPAVRAPAPSAAPRRVSHPRAGSTKCFHQEQSV